MKFSTLRKTGKWAAEEEKAKDNEGEKKTQDTKPG